MDMPPTSIATGQATLDATDPLLGALAALATPVRILDASGTVVWSNAAWASDGDPVGEPWIARVHPDDVPRCRAELALALESGARRESLHRLRRCGSWAWVREHVAPYDVGGQRLVVVSTERVDDDRRELEAVQSDADATLEALELVLA